MKRTFEIVMVIALIGIGVSFLLLTGESRIQNENPGYGIYQETQSDTLRMNSELAPTVTEKLAPFLPTPMCVVDKMLELAEVDANDIVYDLGCGDGRIVIAAAERYGAHGVGLDIYPQWVNRSESNDLLRPMLEKQLKPGVRVVTHNYHMPRWSDKEVCVESLKDEFGKEHTIFVYRP